MEPILSGLSNANACAVVASMPAQNRWATFADELAKLDTARRNLQRTDA
ncbi:hypothetical protein [Paraburkholderia largidicola]|uniref:Uncharacterized protein n=1 Tax=Paraburkholderia largidicola TaxID=3014751 RepID=A0A7I8C3N3_9BURK|nr:hypothetical protein [Paraburkholderia sp. PGU16]BCF95101.1 hypothetical protein PPGU16_81680 [Paraburkholderia sp. PGU16]